ncbi:hypothetical protein A9Q91_01700 [Candidatus Gracilibacteria bacterium 28_42_T64]|nr:hypothetical protein A9Q91_01700 [Candidatus Gracilibacteria bacterium 28_42_T64]
MKNFKLKEEKIPLKLDYNIRIKLYFLMLKKNILNVFSIKNIKFIVPALAMFVFVVGIFNITSNDKITTPHNGDQLVIETSVISDMKVINPRLTELGTKQKTNKYKETGKDRVAKAKTQHYKNLAYVRKVRARQKNMN